MFKRTAAVILAAASFLMMQLSGYARWDKRVIACVGDSITFGACSSWEAYNEEQPDTPETRDQFSYPARLREYLGTSGFKVDNFGMGGATVIYGDGYVKEDEADSSIKTASKAYWAPDASTVTRALHEGSLKSKANVVIMMFGTNDAGETPGIQSGYKNDDGSFSPEKWKAAFKEGYKKLIDEYKAFDTKPELYVMTTPHKASSTWMADRVNPAVREVAAENGVGLIDLEAMMPMDETGTADDIHLNKYSYQKAAQLVAKRLQADGMNFDLSVKNGKNYLTLSSDYSYDSFDLYIAAYRDGRLLETKKTRAAVEYGQPLEISLAWADELSADSFRVMTWDLEEPVTAGRRVSLFEAARNAKGVPIINGTSFLPGENVTMLIRDAENNAVFVDQVKSSADGAYNFIVNLGEGEYTVNVGNSQSNALVRTFSLK